MTFAVTFWGVRGSIASPGPDTVEFGGNTSCVEVVCGDRHIILDSGTGIRGLGQRLVRERKRSQLTILYSHLHWDHLQGLPFFTPLYMPGSEICFCGPKGIEEALSTQMGDPGFPVRLSDVPARLAFEELGDGMRVPIDGGEGRITLTCARLNHPGGVLGYRIDYAGHSLVYATDTEHYSCPDPKLVKLAEGADLLIYDSQYDDDEYAGLAGPPRTGWGHSTFSEGVRVADAARVRQLALYHHDPTHSDAKVRELERRAAGLRPGTFACREGQTLVLATAAAHPATESAAASSASPDRALVAA